MIFVDIHEKMTWIKWTRSARSWYSSLLSSVKLLYGVSEGVAVVNLWFVWPNIYSPAQTRFLFCLRKFPVVLPVKSPTTGRYRPPAYYILFSVDHVSCVYVSLILLTCYISLAALAEIATHTHHLKDSRTEGSVSMQCYWEGRSFRV